MLEGLVKYNIGVQADKIFFYHIKKKLYIYISFYSTVTRDLVKRKQKGQKGKINDIDIAKT